MSSRRKTATAPTTQGRSFITQACLLRGGNGKHDSRPRGQRDRSGENRAAVKYASL